MTTLIDALKFSLQKLGGISVYLDELIKYVL
jgi:hypothetical protein